MQLQMKNEQDNMVLGLPLMVVVYGENVGTDSAFSVNRWAEKTFGNFTYIEMKNTYGYFQDFKIFSAYIRKYTKTDHPIVLLTNIVYIMNWIGWNEYIDSFPVYFCKDGSIKNVQELTDIKLKVNSDVELLYRNKVLQWAEY